MNFFFFFDSVIVSQSRSIIHPKHLGRAQKRSFCDFQLKLALKNWKIKKNKIKKMDLRNRPKNANLNLQTDSTCQFGYLVALLKGKLPLYWAIFRVSAQNQWKPRKIVFLCATYNIQQLKLKIKKKKAHGKSTTIGFYVAHIFQSQACAKKGGVEQPNFALSLLRFSCQFNDDTRYKELIAKILLTPTVSNCLPDPVPILVSSKMSFCYF